MNAKQAAQRETGANPKLVDNDHRRSMRDAAVRERSREGQRERT